MTQLLECKQLTKDFGGKLAVCNLDLTLPRGRIIGLLGPNGSGKTTLIKMINGLLKPASGEILICGETPGPLTKSMVSYLPERTYLDESLNVTDTLAFFQDFYEDFDTGRAEDMLQRLNINPSDRIKSMSKGTKEKVQLILVMSRRAKLYCLDEPIAGVDPAARDYILTTIINNYAEDATVLISTHLISDVENILDDFIFLQNGQIRLHSSVDEIRINQGKSLDSVFREVFRC